MLPNREVEPIISAWQAQIHHAVEAGSAPELALGSSDDVLSTLVGHEALRATTETRTDMTQPLVTAGGASGAWLDALLMPNVGDGAPAPSWNTLYTGADPATHVATSLTTPQHPNGLRPPGDRALPSGIADMIAPALHPASPFNLDTMALRTLWPPGSLFGVRSGGRWLSWLGLLLAVALIAGAVLL